MGSFFYVLLCSGRVPYLRHTKTIIKYKEVLYDMSNITKYGAQGEFSKDFRFIQTIGGKRMIHARGCPYITDWDTIGCREVFEIERYADGTTRYPICPTCEKLVYIALGAEDYNENLRKYQLLFADASTRLVRILFVERKSTCYWCGNRLFITCGEDTWYIDTNVELRLFHNNYNAEVRRLTGEVTAGFHEHTFDAYGVTTRMNSFLRQITGYDFEEADKIHKKRASKRERHTFCEFDPEYYGFKC